MWWGKLEKTTCCFPLCSSGRESQHISACSSAACLSLSQALISHFTEFQWISPRLHWSKRDTYIDLHWSLIQSLNYVELCWTLDLSIPLILCWLLLLAYTSDFVIFVGARFILVATLTVMNMLVTSSGLPGNLSVVLSTEVKAVKVEKFKQSIEFVSWYNLKYDSKTLTVRHDVIYQQVTRWQDE